MDADGKPLRGATLRVVPLDMQIFNPWWKHSAHSELGPARTYELDKNGSVRIDGVAAPRVALEINDRHGCAIPLPKSTRMVLSMDVKELRLRLPRRTSVVLRVVDEKGARVPGAKLWSNTEYGRLLGVSDAKGRLVVHRALRQPGRLPLWVPKKARLPRLDPLRGVLASSDSLNLAVFENFHDKSKTPPKADPGTKKASRAIAIRSQRDVQSVLDADGFDMRLCITRAALFSGRLRRRPGLPVPQSPLLLRWSVEKSNEVSQRLVPVMADASFLVAKLPNEARWELFANASAVLGREAATPLILLDSGEARGKAAKEREVREYDLSTIQSIDLLARIPSDYKGEAHCALWRFDARNAMQVACNRLGRAQFLYLPRDGRDVLKDLNFACVAERHFASGRLADLPRDGAEYRVRFHRCKTSNSSCATRTGNESKGLGAVLPCTACQRSHSGTASSITIPASTLRSSIRSLNRASCS